MTAALVGLLAVHVLARTVVPAAAFAAPPTLTFADGLPKGKFLSPFAVRLRTAALRKPKYAANMTDAQAVRWPNRRAFWLVSAARECDFPPNHAADLVDSIPTTWSRRKRRVAVALTHAFADRGVVVRSGTFFSLISACRRAGELEEAGALLARLEAVGKRPNPNVYSSLMGDLCAAGQPDRALELLGQMRAAGVTPSNVTLTVLLSSLLRANAVGAALDLANELREAQRESAIQYDLPLYNTILQALLAGNADGEVRAVLEHLQKMGLQPSSHTLHILLKGFSQTSLEAALDLFNAFCAAGGTPGLMAYNILLAGFAREGQLLNCEVLLEQLRRQAQSDASSDGLAPDVYTYNALILAATNARKPARALAYRREMVAAGLRADAVTIGLLADAYVENGLPFDAIIAAQRSIDSGELAALTLPCAAKLLTACARASQPMLARRRPDPGAAKGTLLWVLRTLARGEAGAGAQSSADGAQMAAGPSLEQLLADVDAAWYARPKCVRDVLRTLGHAEDFEAARKVFENCPKPRPRFVWSTMIDVCNACGEPAFASAVLAESMPGLGAFLQSSELEKLSGGLSEFVASRAAPTGEQDVDDDDDDDEEEEEEGEWIEDDAEEWMEIEG